MVAPSPAERHSTPVDGVEVLGALSPSRAGDFMTCPLLYRFRTIDRLPEPASPDAVRGTLVHKVLEDLFELPALERTPVRAEQMLEPSWHRLLADEPGLAAIFEQTHRPIGARLVKLGVDRAHQMPQVLDEEALLAKITDR